MSGIINDINSIVDEVNIKPNKTKLVIKWVISVSISLIGISFAFGQFKSSFFNKMDNFEKELKKNTSAIEKLDDGVNKRFDNFETRINLMYDDVYDALEDNQRFNKKQLLLVLDYGQTNKKMLKEILEYNVEEKNKSLRQQATIMKNTVPIDTSQLKINVKQINK